MRVRHSVVRFLRWIHGALVNAAVALVRAYQKGLSPLLGRNCRFHPTCSAYAIEALQKKGLVRGILVTLRRLARCHPFSPGGYDPVEPSPSVPQKDAGPSCVSEHSEGPLKRL